MKKLIVFFVVSTGLLLTSCYKDPGAGTGIIKVIDVNDHAVPGATVKLSQDGSFILYEGMTNQAGIYEFTHQDFQVDFGTQVTLNVDVTYGPRSGGNFIRIFPDKTSNVTVKIYP